MVYLDETTTTELKSKIRCVIADDHVLVRQGIRRLLQDESDVEIVGEAGDAAEALKCVIEVRPDIVLMDIGMPGFSSFDATRVIQTDYPQTRVIFLTMHESQDYVMQGLQAGAAGYFSKDADREAVLDAIDAAPEMLPYEPPETWAMPPVIIVRSSDVVIAGM